MTLCIRPQAGLFPAGAGEPFELSALDGLTAEEVYPRGCGGTLSQYSGWNGSAEEVYPRGCGGTVINSNHPKNENPERSIPAGAGEPD